MNICKLLVKKDVKKEQNVLVYGEIKQTWIRNNQGQVREAYRS
jgi:hypothetical protein